MRCNCAGKDDSAGDFLTFFSSKGYLDGGVICHPNISSWSIALHHNTWTLENSRLLMNRMDSWSCYRRSKPSADYGEKPHTVVLERCLIRWFSDIDAWKRMATVERSVWLVRVSENNAVRWTDGCTELKFGWIVANVVHLQWRSTRKRAPIGTS